jgi:hypothetical protein
MTTLVVSVSAHSRHCDAFTFAGSALAEQFRDLAVVEKYVAFERVEECFGEVIEIEARDFADIFHDQFDFELAAFGADREILAEELVDEWLIIARLGGDAVDGNFDAAGDFAGAHFAAPRPFPDHSHTFRLDRWGAQAQRSLQNFKIGEEKMPAPIVRALGIVKRAAAETNMELGVLKPDVGETVVKAAQEVIEGKLNDTSRWSSGRPARARSRT